MLISLSREMNVSPGLPVAVFKTRLYRRAAMRALDVEHDAKRAGAAHREIIAVSDYPGHRHRLQRFRLWSEPWFADARLYLRIGNAFALFRVEYRDHEMIRVAAEPGAAVHRALGMIRWVGEQYRCRHHAVEEFDIAGDNRLTEFGRYAGHRPGERECANEKPDKIGRFHDCSRFGARFKSGAPNGAR